MPDETSPKPKRVGETISKDQKKALREMFDENATGAEKKYTMSDIAAAVGVSEPTVGKYHKQWDRARNENRDLKNIAFQADPIQALETYLERVPGFSDEKRDFIIESLRANPARASSPSAVLQYLSEIGRLSTFVANEAVSAMFPGQAPQQLQQGPWGGAPGPYGPYGMPPQQQAQGWPQGPWAQPQAPYGWPPPPPPYGWPYPAQPQQQGLTLADVTKAIEEAMGRNEPQTEYEEIEEPIINPTTKEPLTRPDGTPYVRITRRPIGSSGGASALTPLQALREAGAVLRELNPAPPPAPGNSEERNMLMDIKAQLAEEKGRREQSEKDGLKLATSEQALRAAELKAAVAGAGLPPDAQILKSGIEMGDKHLDKLLTNNDRRMDRIEGLIGKLITPQPGGVPMPVDESEIARLEARTRELDAAATAQTSPPAASAPTPPAAEPTPPAIATPAPTETPSAGT